MSISNLGGLRPLYQYPVSLSQYLSSLGTYLPAWTRPLLNLPVDPMDEGLSEDEEVTEPSQFSSPDQQSFWEDDARETSTEEESLVERQNSPYHFKHPFQLPSTYEFNSAAVVDKDSDTWSLPETVVLDRDQEEFIVDLSPMCDHRELPIHFLSEPILRGENLCVYDIDEERGHDPKEDDWRVFGGGVKIYTSTIRFIEEAFGCIDLMMPSPLTFSGSTTFRRLWQEFSDKTRQWKTWGLMETFANEDVILETLLDSQHYLLRIASRTSGCEMWPLQLKEIFLNDLREMSVAIGSIIMAEGTEAFMDLAEEQRLCVMDVIQKLIDNECENRRLLERFSVKMVRERGVLPSYLFLSGIRKDGLNPRGGGGYADVWRGKYGEKAVALKVLRLFSNGVDIANVHKQFCREAMIWRQLDHPNILPFYGVCKDEFAPRFAMVSPWMEGGDLPSYLKQNEYADRVTILEGVATGLSYLHALQPEIIHGDLRGNNILMDEYNNPRIADFGLAKAIDSQANSIVATSYRGRGAMRWQAPELLNASRFAGVTGDATTESDMYAFAFVCLEVFTGKIPFADLRDGQVVVEVAFHDQRPSRPPEPAAARGLDDHMWDLMQDCWRTQPADRPDMSVVLDRLTDIKQRWLNCSM